MTEKVFKKISHHILKQSVNSACYYFMYQPVLPAGTKEKFKK